MILLYTGIAAVVLVVLTAVAIVVLADDTGTHAAPFRTSYDLDAAAGLIVTATGEDTYQPVSYEPYDYPDDDDPEACWLAQYEPPDVPGIVLEVPDTPYLPAPLSEAPTIVPRRSPLTVDIVAALNRRADEIATVRAQPTAAYLDELDRLTRYEHSDATDSFAAVGATWDDTGLPGDGDDGPGPPLDDPFTPPAEWYRELDDAPLATGGSR
jgi:hypothetical protein